MKMKNENLEHLLNYLESEYKKASNSVNSYLKQIDCWKDGTWKLYPHPDFMDESFVDKQIEATTLKLNKEKFQILWLQSQIDIIAEMMIMVDINNIRHIKFTTILKPVEHETV